MASLKQQIQAVLMTAGSEKRQQETRYNFTLEDGQSKIVPFYFQKLDTDGENNTKFDISTNYPASEIDWKSRCSGGYFNLSSFNEDVNGALLGLTWLVLNKHNIESFDTGVGVGAKIDISQSSVLTEIIQDTLKDDDLTRQFVPHIKYTPMQAKFMHFEEDVLPTGKQTSQVTTPFMKCLMISNLTPITTSSVTCQVIQNFYEYTPGVSVPTRGIVDTSEEA